MQGPTRARTSPAPRSRMAWTAAGTTPATRPRQPAWTTPSTPSAVRAIGAQSATCTARVQPATAVTAASASSPACSPGRVTVTTRAPCTWWSQVQGRGATAARRSSTPAEPTARSPWERSVKTTGRALLQERGDVEVVVAVEVLVGEVVLGQPEPAGGRRRGRPTLRLAVPPVEAGGDDRDPHLVAHRVVDDRPEDDVGVRV